MHNRMYQWCVIRYESIHLDTHCALWLSLTLFIAKCPQYTNSSVLLMHSAEVR